MLSLATFVQQIKRKARYGDPDITDDQITADIIHYTNQRALVIWRRYPWSWNIYEFTLAIAANTINYVLDALVGDIVTIDAGNGSYLKKRTLKYYLSRLKGKGGGAVAAYVRRGMDANKALKIKVWPTPDSAVNLSGYAKKRLERYTVADLATNTDMYYFPEEVLPLLETGVMADVYEAQKDKDGAAMKEGLFKKDLEAMINEETTEIDDEEQSPTPDYQKFHKGKRGGTCVT